MPQIQFRCRLCGSLLVGEVSLPYGVERQIIDLTARGWQKITDGAESYFQCDVCTGKSQAGPKVRHFESKPQKKRGRVKRAKALPMPPLLKRPKVRPAA